MLVGPHPAGQRGLLAEGGQEGDDAGLGDEEQAEAALLARPGYLFRLALVVAVVEVIIVVSKFVAFLGEPEWTIWTTNWFINKVFVLGVFVPMLAHMALAPQEYRGAIAGPEARARSTA